VRQIGPVSDEEEAGREKAVRAKKAKGEGG